VIFKGNGCAEHRHQPVSGELVNSAPVALYHRGRQIEQLVDDLAQSFGFQRGGEPHRLHHIREKGCDLVAFEGRVSRVDGRAAGITKPRECAQAISA